MNIHVRPFREEDLDEADRIFRLAFGTFLGLADPIEFFGDADYVRTRWRSPACAAFAAEVDGKLVGSNFATRWGSFGFFGPLTVRPELWDRGIARRLLEPTMETFDSWKTTHRGLFTFPHSPKHHALYQKFGFYPRFLTAVVAKPVAAAAALRGVRRFAHAGARERQELLEQCREVTGSLYPGLDLTDEIRATEAGKLGETLVLESGGLAVCHVGKGTEAGSDTCYVKFGTVRTGPGAAREFEQLLDAFESFAAAGGAARLTAGVNLAHEGAYRSMLSRGFRTEIVGVAMQSGNQPGYNRPEVFAIDDWR